MGAITTLFYESGVFSGFNRANGNQGSQGDEAVFSSM
jgi:hypothetical protein